MTIEQKHFLTDSAFFDLYLAALNRARLRFLFKYPAESSQGKVNSLPRTVGKLKDCYTVFLSHARNQGIRFETDVSSNSAVEYFRETISTPALLSFSAKGKRIESYSPEFFKLGVNRSDIIHTQILTDRLLDDILLALNAIDSPLYILKVSNPHATIAKILKLPDPTNATLELKLNQSLSFNIAISNISCPGLCLTHIRVIPEDAEIDIASSVNDKSFAKCGITNSVAFNLKLSKLGTAFMTIRLEFNSGQYMIRRSLFFRVIDPKYESIIKEIRPTQPFTRPISKKAEFPDVIVPGVKPSTGGFIGKEERKWLLPYPLPKEFQKDVENITNSKGSTVLATKKYAGGNLSHINYKTYFTTALFLEEHQLLEDVKSYDIEFAEFKRTAYSDELLLDVPGLSEKRPSVLFGDRIFAKPSNDATKAYEGFVYKVENESIIVRFDRVFHTNFITGAKYHVRFSFSRSAFKRAHRGIEHLQENMVNLRLWLFPEYCQLKKAIDENVKVDKFLHSLNEKQTRAVKAILSRSHGGAPFVIFGPPGTGKTTTMVKAIQEYSKLYAGRILVLAPSNNAADYICYRLSSVFSKSQMFRIHAYQRSDRDIQYKLAIMRHSIMNDDGKFSLPPLETLKKYRVIISTCASASLAWEIGLGDESKNSHFSAIFCDEAGHASEPEFFSSIACFVSGKKNLPQLIVCGDPKQLGPLIRSPLAQHLDLHKSFLERITSDLEIYKRDPTTGYDERAIVRLTDNYRSHPSILSIYSDLFYDGQLRPCADINSRNAFVGWDALPNNQFPIVFHGVVGIDEREGNSPSWMNLDEIQVVLQWVDRILDTKGRGIKPTSIGIVTPYRKQVLKLRASFRGNRKYDGIQVDTAEGFQGQEKEVMIITTVRSSMKHLDADIHFHLGFLFSAKRFNVAVSRAKSLLIAIGNPHVLARDANWRHFIAKCRENQSCLGETIPDFALDSSPQYQSTELMQNDCPLDDMEAEDIDPNEWEFVN